MKHITVKRVIKAPLDKVRAFVWDIQSWAQFWSPLHEVRVLYDDGIHQDFELKLDWEKQETLVRTVRFKKHDGNISFFSPTAPFPTSIHQGSWNFYEQADGTTELVATRSFLVPDFVHLDEFSLGFTQRLERLLEKIGMQCEQ